MTVVQTCALLIFFFFKQKTAYEIYQCDWSSDVCSSDLEPSEATADSPVEPETDDVADSTVASDESPKPDDEDDTPTEG